MLAKLKEFIGKIIQAIKDWLDSFFEKV